MTERRKHLDTLVVKDVKDEDGVMWRAIHLKPSGEFVIEGHDLGPGVEGAFGCSEYEFFRTLSPSETAELRGLLSLAATDDLLKAIGGRFDSTADLETFLKQYDIEGSFWNRIGD